MTPSEPYKDDDDDKRRVTFQILMLARRRHGPFRSATSSVGLWMHVATWCRFSLKFRGFYWSLESQESQQFIFKFKKNITSFEETSI